MHVHHHVILGFIFSLILFPLVGFFSLIIFISSFMIDIDHYFYYIIKKNDLNLINSINYYLKKHREESVLFFHSVEFIALKILHILVNQV